MCEREFAYFAIALDDGYFRQYLIAKLFNKFNVKTSVYCITHQKRHPHDDEPLLTIQPRRIKMLADEGNEIGSHTCTHPNLLKLGAVVEKELKQSKRFLERLISVPVLGIAYPYGYCNAKLINKAKKYYKYGRSFHVNHHLKGSNHKVPSKFLLDSVCLGSVDIIVSAVIRSVRNPDRVNMIILLHNESFAKIFLLLLATFFLKLIPTVKLTTVRKIAERIE